LCAQAFLVGKDADKICKELEATYRDGDMKKIGELWWKRGAIGRLYNIIRYIRASPQRCKFFKLIELDSDLAIFNGLELIQSQATQWNLLYVYNLSSKY
jgi:hypothetical protein